ncbi:outer membrane usher protein [Salmonella enterica subsp. enterica serovar Choleraesuis]|nr:outer membrane usher protein [Salmonella enterica subsp. enterica serovar Choleraesuis]
MKIINACLLGSLPLFSITGYVWADEYFNPAFLTLDEEASENVDLSQFEQHGSQAPGKYEFNVKLNQFDIKQLTVDIEHGDGEPLVARFTKKQLSSLGIDLRKLASIDSLAEIELVPPLEKLIPGSAVRVDFLNHAIRLSVPQKYINWKAQGSVAPDEWDNGITTLFSNYTFSGSHNQQRDYGTRNKNYLNLRNGLNFGAWRVRNTAIWSNNRWDSTNTYITRNLLLLGGSRFTLGEYWSNSLLFDTFQFRGVTLESDDSMLPESMKGFAPVIRGIAKTNAKVEVKQNGFIIYQDWVPPGSFEIRDLHPTTSSGDLQVSIYEANGEVRHFQEPYSGVPVMQREGQVKYNVTSGFYDSENGGNRPGFVQGTLAYGVSNRLTIYSGLIAAENYSSYGAGVGLGLGDFGALSTDVVGMRGRSRSELQHDNKMTESSYIHAQYSKVIQPTATEMNLEGYFYNNNHYLSFSDANSYPGRGHNNFNLKRKINATVNQPLPGELGELYFSSSLNTYWQDTKSDNSFNLGYSLYYNDISYNLTLSQTTSSDQGGNDRQLAFSVQIPLGGPHTRTWMSWNTQSSNHERSSHQVGLNGLSMADNALAWSVQESLNSDLDATSGNLQANYRSRYNQSNIGYSYSHRDRSQQINYGMNGGIVMHQGGVTLSQPLGDTFGLVNTEHVSDIKLEHTTNVTTDSAGYAVVPYLTPYHHNSMAIDPASFSNEVEADKTRKDAVPTKGAVILRRFDLRKGYKALFALRKNKDAIPFGAQVTLRDSTITSMVGDNGEVYLSGLPASGVIDVSLGRDEAAYCSAAFNINNRDVTNGIFIKDIECH